MADPTNRLSFEEFREYLTQVVERMHAAFVAPEATWPGVLFLEVPEQGLVVGEMRSLAGFDELDKQHLATTVLPARIRQSRADRFGWVMPAWRNSVSPPVECLALVVGDPYRREVVLADVLRENGRSRLAPWSPPMNRADGLFVEPLCRALLAKPRHRRPRSGRRSAQPQPERKQVRGGPDRGEPRGSPLQPSCPDCGAKIAEPHGGGCDVERCSVCFGQRLMCECPDHDPLAEAWRGEWPGAAECRALGWWAVRLPEKGWRPCPPGTPGAREDINRLTFFRKTGYDCLYDELEQANRWRTPLGFG
jgi:hypothetical protein